MHKVMFAGDSIFVGICGGTASGKTTLCSELETYFAGDVQVISQDAYYIDRSHLTEEEVKVVNFDHPESINSEQLYRDITTLKEKKEVFIPQYCFKTHSILREKKRIAINKINIIEGLFVFREEHLRKLFDIKIFIHASADIRLIRRIRRDTEYRGRDVLTILDQYLSSVKPMHDKYIAEQSKYADCNIDTTNSQNLASDARLLASKIEGVFN